MPRRAAARGTDLLDPLSHQQSPIPSSSDHSAQNLTLLRTHWKWAAFSQFFFTFSHLFSMEDVSLNDIEDDLARETNLFLPRVMARLLYVLSYDRKVGLDNWQSALRRQHNRRDPASNPIGPEPRTDSGHPHYRYASVSVDNDTPAPADGEDNGMEQDSVAHSEADRAASEKGSDSAPPRERTEGEESQNEAPDKVVEEEEQSQQETKDWLDLPMLAKLDSLHLLTEWQCQNPTRLRSLMKTDDEDATWRIEPIGYDAKSNAYWLIGADRLWIQRVQPKPPRYTATTSSLKRKRLPPTAASTSKAKRPAPKRARLANDAPASNGKLTITVPGGGRAAKANAKLKLEGQAQELAALNREAASAAAAANKRKRGRTEVAAVRPLGTRLSARLRGADEEEWQPMPAAWLEDEGSKGGKNGGASGSKKGKAAVAVKPPPKTGLESDDESVSELTELSEDPAEEENVKEEEAAEPAEAGVSVLEEANADDNNNNDQPEGFVEWETICITLYEWEHIAERFEKATHYTEKALYKTLVNNIVPIITEELREIERKKRLEEAIVHRKRSSRIANKESEKEEARAAARQRAEAQEKKTRAQRLEARLAKEEADRERREAARELRRREKEKASEGDAQERTDSESMDMQVDVVGNDIVLMQNGNAGASQQLGNGGGIALTASSSTSGTRTPMGDDWILNCEICRRSGMNVDDGVPLLCCGLCSQWQHIPCHDRADMQAGRPRRNWDHVEFVCQSCQLRRTAKNANTRQYQQQQQPAYRPLAPAAASPSYPPIASSSSYALNGAPSSTYTPNVPASSSYTSYNQTPPPGGSRGYPVNGATAAYVQQQPGMLAARQLPLPYPNSTPPANYLPVHPQVQQPRLQPPIHPQSHSPQPRQHSGSAYNSPTPYPQHNAPVPHQQHQQHAAYDRPPAQYAHQSPTNGYRTSPYQRPPANVAGWNSNVPPPVVGYNNAPYTPNGAQRTNGERHQYGEGAHWHGGGSQQTAAYGYHNGA